MQGERTFQVMNQVLPQHVGLPISKLFARREVLVRVQKGNCLDVLLDLFGGVLHGPGSSGRR